MTEVISIYESIARNLGDVEVKGVPTGCTPTSLDYHRFMNPLSETLVGKEVFIYSGGGAGQSRMIASYSPSSKRIIIDGPWDTTPTANSKFLIFSHFFTEEYESAMNRAIGMAKPLYLIDKVATMQLAATQYEYAVPSGMEYIRTLRLVPSGNTDYGADDEVNRAFEFPPRYWRIESNPGGSYVISFDSRKLDLDNYDKEVVYIMGQAKAEFGATTLPSDVEEYIIAHCSMQLAAQKTLEGDAWQRLFYMYRDQVGGRGTTPGLEAYIFKYGQGRKVGG